MGPCDSCARCTQALAAFPDLGSWTVAILVRPKGMKGFDLLPRRSALQRAFAWFGSGPATRSCLTGVPLPGRADLLTTASAIRLRIERLRPGLRTSPTCSSSTAVRISANRIRSATRLPSCFLRLDAARTIMVASLSIDGGLVVQWRWGANRYSLERASEMDRTTAPGTLQSGRGATQEYQIVSAPELGQHRVAIVAGPLVAAAILVGVSALRAFAQSSDGHTEHHPSMTPSKPGMSAPTGPATPPSNPPAGSSTAQPSMAGTGSSGGMGDMGEMMGRPRKEFYPSLMDIPTPTPEQRQAIEIQARVRVSSGIDEIASAQTALRHANAVGDTAGAEQATSRLRNGLNLVSSGSTALRSLAEGKPPPQVAQDWFKVQLNLAPSAITHAAGGPLGLSWFHVITMSVVAAFAAAMLALHLVRMRRANALAG